MSKKYNRNKVAIFDSNLLLLFILGINNNQNKIHHSRLNKYKMDHFNELTKIFNTYDFLVTLPQILLETFYLLKHPSKKNKIPQINYLYNYSQVINLESVI